ncbi:MAG: VWA domain-containing protein [Rikenellaceae bacterium]
MFRFATPQYLYLLLLLPLLLVLFAVVKSRRKRRIARFGNPEIMSLLMPEVSRWRPRFKSLLLIVSLASLIVAAARPQLGSKLREESSQGVEMMFAVDVSNSMLAEDFEPNRLERTKYAINRLFEGMDQDRAGLIAFAGDASVQLPITSDFRMAAAFVNRLSPNLVGMQGTSVSKALDLALLSFSEQSKASKVIILITDGESHDDNAIATAERAKAQGVKIFTVGIGTPEGAPISIDGEFIKDQEGNMVVSKLNEEMLEEIASISEGGYVKASKQDIGLDEVIRTINDLEKGELSTVKFEEYNELFQYLIALAMLLLWMEFYLLERRSKVLGRFNIFREDR